MKTDPPWWSFFAFIRDGISGSELLGMILVAGMVFILCVVQYGERGASKRVDFAWLFMDDKTGKVSRSGVMAFGGFILGCWVVVDAESIGKLDWSFLGIFLSYCAGVRAIEVFKPKDDPQQSVSKTVTTHEETLVAAPAPAPAPTPDAPLPVKIVAKEPVPTREVPAEKTKKRGR